MVSKINSKWKKHLRQKKGNKCQICGKEQVEIAGDLKTDQQNRLRLHHIQNKKEGGDNHQKNLILLCPKCEDKFHDRKNKKIN